MALTLRLTQDQENNLSTLKERLNEKTSSQVILKLIGSYSDKLDTIQEQSKKISDLEKELRAFKMFFRDQENMRKRKEELLKLSQETKLLELYGFDEY